MPLPTRMHLVECEVHDQVYLPLYVPVSYHKHKQQVPNSLRKSEVVHVLSSWDRKRGKQCESNNHGRPYDASAVWGFRILAETCLIIEGHIENIDSKFVVSINPFWRDEIHAFRASCGRVIKTAINTEVCHRRTVWLPFFRTHDDVYGTATVTSPARKRETPLSEMNPTWTHTSPHHIRLWTCSMCVLVF